MSTTYDQVPYIGLPFVQTHPDRLATVAALFGVDAPPVNRCRVLEVGSGDGGNLIPMAMQFPESRFVGIDLAETAIARANHIARQLDLKNIESHAMNILDAGADLGSFDYIIAHGVYSWVPPEVQRRLLQLCGELLTPSGVAYISYNSKPGALLRTVVRDMLQYYVGPPSGHADPVAHGKKFLKFVSSSITGTEERYEVVRSEIQDTLEREAYVVFHDEMAHYFTPEYFHEFMSQASEFGLKYLGEATIREMSQVRLKPDLMEQLRQAAGNDPVRTEQFADFVRCTKFRKTLLVRNSVAASDTLQPDRLRSLYISSNAILKFDGDVMEAQGPRESSLKAKHPLVKSMMVQLSHAWPESLHFSELLKAVKAETGSEWKEDELEGVILPVFLAGLLELHVVGAGCHRGGERPKASVLARWQATEGLQVTTLRHGSINVTGELERALLALLDGTRTRDEIARELYQRIRNPVPFETFRAEIDNQINTLGKLGVLCG